ncbi:MAG: L-serine ammonia-lyase, iron-sulfur-dependent, subunit alpha, partial [Gallicola sp.]|nr:L-serine ammonia-lyase, iron-sulfur-dependent, subunit alpha [Gallicola sp.]
SASAMAAAGIVQMMGGTPEQSFHAASICLVNILGLVCDPIAGLVEYPCTFRNANGVVNAMISSDMALAGVKSVVPFEEVCVALQEVGERMPPSLRETGVGGLAGTPTGQRIKKEVFG